MKILFVNDRKEQLVKYTDESVILCILNKTSITQSGLCHIIKKHTHKYKLSRFFIGPGDCQELLGIADTEILNVMYRTTEPSRQTQNTNEHSQEMKSYTNENFKS